MWMVLRLEQELAEWYKTYDGRRNEPLILGCSEVLIRHKRGSLGAMAANSICAFTEHVIDLWLKSFTDACPLSRHTG